jgi:hypothetical protein
MQPSMKGKKKDFRGIYTVFLHNDEEFDDNLRGRPNHNLTLSSFLSIVHTLKSIVQNTDSHHGF